MSFSPNHDPHDSHLPALATSLGPALIDQLQGRITNLQWFKSSHQRGGAATALATYTDDQGTPHDAVLKLPVGYHEFRWTCALAQLHTTDHAPTPRVLASGTSVGGHDLAWIILERLAGSTHHQGWSQRGAEQLIFACAQMQALAQRFAPVDRVAVVETDWEAQIERARKALRDSDLPEAQHWRVSERRVSRALPHLIRLWNARPIDTWCHGDLHPGNAMHRTAAPDRTVLIDLALVHPGHWIEDAVYLERQFWATEAPPDEDPDVKLASVSQGRVNYKGLFGVHPVTLMGKFRRQLGLTTEGDYGLVASVRRVLMAACAPAHLVAEGNPAYLRAALNVIDRVLPTIEHAHEPGHRG